MSPEEISAKYHNLRYAVLSICDCIESCSVKKVVEEKYLPMLDDYNDRLTEIKKELAKEMSDKKKQKDRWADKINKLCADAACDETISDELRERIIEKLKELAEGVKGHEDS
tara:strand:- start:746 stop:1081 length:336 start_codon:yes stop_codon:yes gene_type:complete